MEEVYPMAQLQADEDDDQINLDTKQNDFYNCYFVLNLNFMVGLEYTKKELEQEQERSFLIL